jgi:hypothetical protein
MQINRTLGSHPFVGMLHRIVMPELIQEIGQIIEKARAEASGRSLASRPKPEPQIGKVNPYHIQVNKECGQLTEAVGNLKLSLFLLRRYPKRQFSRSRMLPQMKWIHYHYSNFVVGFVSIYDIALVMTNIVFRLGIPENKCRNDVVRENSWVKKTSVYSALRRLDERVSTYRQIRHGFVHRGLQPKIDEITWNWLQSFLEVEISSPKESRDLEPRFSSRLINQIVKRLRLDLTDLEQAILKFYDAIQLVYKDHASRLQG